MRNPETLQRVIVKVKCLRFAHRISVNQVSYLVERLDQILIQIFESDIMNCQQLTLLRCTMMELHQKPQYSETYWQLFHATNIAQVHTEDLQKILGTFQGRLILVENIRSVEECKIVAFSSKSSLCSCPCGLSPHILVLVPVMLRL